LGLALLVSFLIHIIAISQKGFVDYVKHFFQPFAPFVVIHLIDEVARPVTLAFRLFGNVMAGKILLAILDFLTPYLIPMLWLGFKMFIGVIQAFIFTVLSIAYISNSYKTEH
jgi:F-type H+-transporting ATPase subunit a